MKEKLNKIWKKSSKTMFFLLIFIACIGIVAAAYSIIHTFSASDQPYNSGSSKALIQNGAALQGSYQPKSQSEILAELQKQQVTVTDRVSAEIAFPKGELGTKGSWVVENPSSNTVIMQCEITYQGKTIATSAPIRPGEHIESIVLSSSVPTGTHDVTASINYYDEYTQSYLSKAEYKIKMDVQ